MYQVSVVLSATRIGKSRRGKYQRIECTPSNDICIDKRDVVRRGREKRRDSRLARGDATGEADDWEEFASAR